MDDYGRTLIFVSHATPEDNAFVLWISTRLKLLGYDVWSDVTQLFGGEKWWGDIEQAVDQFTIKFVLVITKTSLSKPGVQREIELALSAEKKYGHKNFIIPVIIDDSEFGGQPYGLSERNIISFSSGWAPGLGKLVERLKRDNVPLGEVTENLGAALSSQFRSPLQLHRQNDLVLSNWLNIKAIPRYLNFYRLPIAVNQWRKTFDGCPWVWFEWGGMLATFATVGELRQFLPRHFTVSEAPVLDLYAVIQRQPRNHPVFLRTEVIKKMNFLLAEAWHAHMQRLGLHKYELSSGKVAWFFPGKEKFSGMIPFADICGVQKKKKVNGYSAKNLVSWHYAIEPKVQYGPQPKFCLIPHVVFTQDGLNPLQNKDKMHSLRRGFCKSWWNARWRDLLLVYMEVVSQGCSEIDISLASGTQIVCESRPQIIPSIYSLSSAEQVEEVDDDEDFVDELVDIEVIEA